MYKHIMLSKSKIKMAPISGIPFQIIWDLLKCSAFVIILNPAGQYFYYIALLLLFLIICNVILLS